MTVQPLLRRQIYRASLLAGLGLLPWCAEAALPSLVTSTPAAGGGQNFSLSLDLLILMTALSFLPAVLLMMTSFTRIIIVLSLLRMALGTQGSPPNQVLIGIALFLSLFVMNPVLERIYTDAYQPLSENRISSLQALEKASVPLREFMLRQTRQNDLDLFLRMANVNPNTEGQAVPFQVLVPAFATSELRTAFQIGFAIFVPFLIIDMIVATVLMAMGMMMVSPSLVSLPFKIMLFVLVDGWQLLIGSLGSSFA